MTNATIDELAEIRKLTIALVKLRQNECKDVCVMNISKIIFGSLLGELLIHKQDANK